MHRFFISPSEINWQEKNAVISDTNQVYKISNVLRLRENDQVVLLDGKGLVYNAQIILLNNRSVKCRLLSRRAVNTEPDLKITIAQSLLKAPKFDYVLQKNAEIGISEFIPVTTERTVLRLDEDGDLRKQDKRIERYQRIVMEASEQSERGSTPIVRDITSLEELCRSNLSTYNLKIICQERTQSNLIRDVLNGVQGKIHNLLILVGPEGGFTEAESKLVLASGFLPVSLGKRIYRSETVGLITSAIIYFYFNELK